MINIVKKEYPLRQNGFTLIELVVYASVLAIIMLAVSAFLLWSIRSNHKAKVLRELADGNRRALEVMTSEIRRARSIYTPTSAFGVDSGQLSLETVDFLPSGEKITYIDFFLCGEQLCMKKESQDPIFLTSEKVRVDKLLFTSVATSSQSVQIDLQTSFDDETGKAENQSSLIITNTASIRGN